MVKHMIRGEKGMFALTTTGTIHFRGFKDGRWKRVIGPAGSAVNELVLGSDGLFAVTSSGKIMFRPKGRRNRGNWRVYDGPAV